MENNNINTGANAGQGQTEATGTEKTFTQEEVNRIVQERLARSKNKEPQAGEESGNSKEAELKAREMNIIAREKLLDAELGKECMPLLAGASDEKEILQRIEVIKSLKGNAKETNKSEGFTIGAPGGDGNNNKTDAIRQAMGL